MDITIKDEICRFGCRVSIIILNSSMNKILVQKLKDIYMLPGGRLKVGEDSKLAIERELEEELDIIESVRLKYHIESFTIFPNGKKYHEIGYYYICVINEEKYGLNNKLILNHDYKRDGQVFFQWIDINNIDNYNIIPRIIIDKIKDRENLMKCDIEYLIYREW